MSGRISGPGPVETIRVLLNGDSTELPAELTLSDFVARLGLDPRAVAIERNGLIAPRATYSSTVVEDGDRLEVVHFVQGG